MESTPELSSSSSGSVLFSLSLFLSLSLYSHYIHNLPCRMSECGSYLHSVLGRTGLGIVLGIVLFFSELVGFKARCCSCCCCCSAEFGLFVRRCCRRWDFLSTARRKRIRFARCSAFCCCCCCCCTAHLQRLQRNLCVRVSLASLVIQSTAKLLCIVISSILEEHRAGFSA